MSNVEFCEIWAGPEHIGHIRHILGIKILYSFYLRQIIEWLEPLITTRRSCIGKRSIEHNLGNIIIVVSAPSWLRLATIECILIFAQNLLVSTTECQCAVSIFHPRAVIISLVTEVSAIYLGIGLIDCFIWPIDVTGERATTWKHILAICHSSSSEFAWRIDSLQVGTAVEHSEHSRYLRCIELRDIERGELFAPTEQ